MSGTVSAVVSAMSSATAIPTTTTSSASPSPTQGNGNGNGGPSSPLLFFVALGFGVVFTNLWIIVGVKYCFRYNQRNRARIAGDDPDAVDLAAMPRQRRRREKKLMTMEEVNEKFPLTKYKTWRSTRAQEGLPTAGGINTASSRPASVKNMPRVSEDDDKEGAQSHSEVAKEKTSSSEPSSPVVTRHDQATTTTDTEGRPKTSTSETVTVPKTKTNEDEEDDADHIQTAIPAEQLPDPGDCCAICIDVLEDDDDIRGLICGHAFHASCVDPWLTSRRACCPLCKADYYTPKPRAEVEAEELRRRNIQEQNATIGFMGARRGRGPPIQIFTRHFLTGQHPPTIHGRPSNRRAMMQRQQTEAANNTNADQSEQQTQQQHSWRTRLNLPRLPVMSRVRNTNGANGEGQQPAAPTPAQLESGQNR